MDRLTPYLYSFVFQSESGDDIAGVCSWFVCLCWLSFTMQDDTFSCIF